jgi:hypothetical protein
MRGIRDSRDRREMRDNMTTRAGMETENNVMTGCGDRLSSLHLNKDHVGLKAGGGLS